MQTEDFTTNWIDRVKAGDPQAAGRIWDNYYSRLVAMARQRLNGAPVAVSDEEDIAISVFESFYRAAEDGRFPDLNSRDDLWKLLLRMAARKIIDQHRHANRAVRGGGVATRSIDAADDDKAVFEVIGSEPNAEMVAMVTESCELLLTHLEDENLRAVAIGKLEGYSNSELAQRLDCSERTVERRLNLVRQKAAKELLPHG